MIRQAGRLGFKKFIPAIGWFFIVLLLMCLPGDDIPDVDDWFQRIYFDKLVHLGIFALMAYLFMRPIGLAGLSNNNKMSAFIYIAIGLCLWGLATEFIQRYLVRGRSFDLLDWAADSAGTLLALIFSKRLFIR